jgi:hypothetical protein
MTTCPHCEYKLTSHEIGVLFGSHGGSTISATKGKSSVANGRVMAILIPRDVANIRRSNEPMQELAEKYKVSYRTIWRIKRNKIWKP